VPLLITVDESRQVLTMPETIDVLEQAYSALGEGEAVNAPTGGRMDVAVPLPDGSPGLYFPGTSYVFGSLQAAIRPLGVFAVRFKSDMMYSITEGAYRTREKYCIEPGRYCGIVLVFSIWNGELLAIIHDSFLQHMRVGATAGLGAKLLARNDAEAVGMIGSGGMARTYLEAFSHVRPIRRVRVFSPHRDHGDAFAREMRAKLEIEIDVVESAAEAARGTDILATCTDSARPVIEAGDVEAGMHLSPVTGSELPRDALARIDLLVRHLDGGNVAYRVGGASPDLDSGDPTRNAEAPTLADLITAKTAGRANNQQVTCFYNVPGSGVQFAAAGLRVYELAKKRGLGRELPLDWFLEDERD
jgi:ornithine cyclodeaminase/alanine dehydrogenase-like protein (mu-crystallin family)